MALASDSPALASQAVGRQRQQLCKQSLPAQSSQEIPGAASLLPLAAAGADPSCLGTRRGVWGHTEVLLSLGHDEVSQHVEGVAVWMHRHNPTVLLVDLQEPGIIEAHNGHLWPLAAAQADLLTTENEAHQHQGHRRKWKAGTTYSVTLHYKGRGSGDRLRLLWRL